jgi:hypothetical protein
LSWASITPFGVPVVPEVKTSSKTSRARAGHAATCASQSAGSVRPGRRRAPRRSSSGSARARLARDRARRARCRGSGAAPEAATMPSTASVDMRRSSGTRIEAGPHRPEIGRRQLRRRRRPGQQPVARLEPERPQAPAPRSATPSSSRYVQLVVDPSSSPEAERVLFAGRAATASSRRSSRVSRGDLLVGAFHRTTRIRAARDTPSNV